MGFEPQKNQVAKETAVILLPNIQNYHVRYQNIYRFLSSYEIIHNEIKAVGFSK